MLIQLSHAYRAKNSKQIDDPLHYFVCLSRNGNRISWSGFSFNAQAWSVEVRMRKHTITRENKNEEENRRKKSAILWLLKFFQNNFVYVFSFTYTLAQLIWIQSNVLNAHNTKRCSESEGEAGGRDRERERNEVYTYGIILNRNLYWTNRSSVHVLTHDMAVYSNTYRRRGMSFALVRDRQEKYRNNKCCTAAE